METIIQTISFETELRKRKSSEYRSLLDRFGAQQRVEAGVYETADSRGSILNVSLSNVPEEILEKLLLVLEERHKAQVNWIMECNSTVYKHKPRCIPSDKYSTIIMTELQSRREGTLNNYLSKSDNVGIQKEGTEKHQHSGRRSCSVEDCIIAEDKYSIIEDMRVNLKALPDGPTQTKYVYGLWKKGILSKTPSYKALVNAGFEVHVVESTWNSSMSKLKY